MKEAISQEMMADSSHSCIPEENENSQQANSFKSAAMLGIALSVGASGVIVSQSEASAAISAPAASATESFSNQADLKMPPTTRSETDRAAATQNIVAYHTVENGQSLWQIAQQHRVGLRDLKAANDLPPETSIRVGQVLKVPASNQAAETPNAQPSELIAKLNAEEPLERVDTRLGAQSIKKDLTTEESVAELPEKEQTAALDNTPPASEVSIEIADASSEVAQLDSADIESEPVVTALATPASFSHYQVRSGDTLSKIASSLGTTSEELIRANALVNPNIILAGDTLRVPTSAGGYVPAQPAYRELARRSDSTQSEVSEQQTEASQIARLRSTAVRPDNSALIEELRDAVPQEPASVGGETVTQRDLLSSRPGRDESIDPYVANLLEEVREIRSRSVQVSEVEASIDETAVFEEVAIESDRASLLARRNEQQRSTSNLSERIASSEAGPTADINSELLAAAPLSPDAYIPAQRPAAGQVVSPDMPMLPDAEEYLPEAPNYFDGYIWPARGTLTSGYGWRWGRMHRGVDVAGPVGTPIVAAGAGVVERAGWNSGGYGNLVDIRHPDGSLTRYAHNNSLSVSAGQTVRQGQQIAEMGSTGYSTGPHLHFEIHKSGSGAVNPMAYLPNR